MYNFTATTIGSFLDAEKDYTNNSISSKELSSLMQNAYFSPP
jgi:hypothetical protein